MAFIVYATLGGDDKNIPIYCKRIKTSTVLDETLLLEEITGLQDPFFTKFKIESIHVKKSEIRYILHGEVKDERKEESRVSQNEREAEKRSKGEEEKGKRPTKARTKKNTGS